MDVYEAVRTRQSVRGFIDRPVPVKLLERVVSAATWAPSGSNIQPWHIYVVTGARLAELKRLASARVAARDPWAEREYEMDPAGLNAPDRRAQARLGRAGAGPARHRGGGPGGAAAGGVRERGLLRRARRPVLLHPPRHGPAAVVRRGRVPADGHAAAPRRRAAQL